MSRFLGQLIKIIVLLLKKSKIMWQCGVKKKVSVWTKIIFLTTLAENFACFEQKNHLIFIYLSRKQDIISTHLVNAS